MINRHFLLQIVCVDEATANVDLETDLFVQEVLQSCLLDRTVLTIAHRVETVMSCDRIIVMSHGRAVEIGNPRQLVQDRTSEFSKLLSIN